MFCRGGNNYVTPYPVLARCDAPQARPQCDLFVTAPRIRN